MTLTMKKRKERAYAHHQPKWQRFQTALIKPTNTTKPPASQPTTNPLQHPYQRQYSHVYHQRLIALKPRCFQAIDQDTSNTAAATKVERILELRNDVLSVVVGTIVKEGGSSNDNKKDLLHPDVTRCTSSQTLFIEDESGRCNLIVENVHDYCTGMILGLVGKVDDKQGGSFIVQKVYYPTSVPHPKITTPSTTTTKVGTPHVLLISGLQCGDPSISPLYRNMILDYVRGHFDSQAGSNIAQVVIAGGSTATTSEGTTTALKELDAFCLQLCALGVGVDILPGKDDPTTANWPQRPFHKSLLKYTDRHLGHLLARTPNPYAAIHSDKYLLGTDGTNVTDLAKNLLLLKNNKDEDDYNEEEDASSSYSPVTHLQALRKTLDCGHICPTGPDTVPTMPHPEQDPMVLKETPHLYFAGNCNRYETSLVEFKQGGKKEEDVNCRLVCIPKFAETGQVVLVNLDTMDVQELKFEEP